MHIHVYLRLINGSFEQQTAGLLLLLGASSLRLRHDRTIDRLLLAGHSSVSAGIDAVIVSCSALSDAERMMLFRSRRAR